MPHCGASAASAPQAAPIKISAKTGAGIDALRERMRQIAAQQEHAQSDILVANERHHQALLAAAHSNARAIDAIQAGLSGDLIALDIRATIDALGSILGTITSADILSTIFSRFCIGK